ncbi:MAG: DUF29 family protein [Pseudanabaenaceae cyanobacterium]
MCNPLGILLKWGYQPEQRSKSWLGTIRGQPTEIQELLVPDLKSAIPRGYRKALHLVDRETPLEIEQLPQSCPFTEKQKFT